MRRYKVFMEYCGTGLIGWQRQGLALNSVQSLIEESIYRLAGEKVEVIAAGRTDAGVHAYAQVAHFDLNKEMPIYRIRDGLNYHLHSIKRNAVAVTTIEHVPDHFHARFDAKQRSYIYKIVNRPAPLAIMNSRAWHVRRALDLSRMKASATYLIGKHDFSSFRASGCQASSPIKNLDEIIILSQGNEVNVIVTAPSFLYNQVRNIVGTLVKIGKGDWAVEEMPEILLAKNRERAGPTAPPHGLYFNYVRY